MKFISQTKYPGRIFTFQDEMLFEFSFLKPRKLDRVVEKNLMEVWDYHRRCSILEVGCGSGRFLKWLDDLGHRVAGVEASSELVERAYKRLPSRVAVRRAFAENLPFEDSSFDYVCFIFSLEFVQDPVRAVSEGLRVARKGVFIASIQKSSPIVVREYFRSRTRWIWGDGTSVTYPGGLEKVVGTAVDTTKRCFPIWTKFKRLWPNDKENGHQSAIRKIFAPVILASIKHSVPVEGEVSRVFVKGDKSRLSPLPLPARSPIILRNTLMNEMLRN